MQQQSQIFAQRLEREAADDVTAQVRRGYWLAYQRAPDDDEIADSVKLAREHRLKAFCLALFNSNEFMYVH